MVTLPRGQEIQGLHGGSKPVPGRDTASRVVVERPIRILSFWADTPREASVGMAMVRRVRIGDHQAHHRVDTVPAQPQGQRVDPPAVKRIDGDKHQLERDADGEGAVEIGGGVNMAVVVSCTHLLFLSLPAKGLAGLISQFEHIRILE